MATSGASAGDSRASIWWSDHKVSMGKGGNNLKKHEKLPASERKPKGDYSKKVIENVAFWKKHKMNYTAGSKSKATRKDTKPENVTEGTYVSLRYLDQFPFEHYLTMSQKQENYSLTNRCWLTQRKLFNAGSVVSL